MTSLLANALRVPLKVESILCRLAVLWVLIRFLGFSGSSQEAHSLDLIPQCLMLALHLRLDQESHAVSSLNSVKLCFRGTQLRYKLLVIFIALLLVHSMIWQAPSSLLTPMNVLLSTYRFFSLAPYFLGPFCVLFLVPRMPFADSWVKRTRPFKPSWGILRGGRSLLLVLTTCSVAAAWAIITLLSNLSAIFPFIPSLKEASCGKEFCLPSYYSLNSHVLVLYRAWPNWSLLSYSIHYLSPAVIPCGWQQHWIANLC